MIKEKVGLELLHQHTHFSLLDGLGTCDEYGKRSVEIDQKYLCITDHGMMGAIPSQVAACEKYNLTPVYGCELYMRPEQPDMQKLDAETQESLKQMRKSYHLLAIAVNDEGYRNLVRLSSWGWLHGFYYKPRVNTEQLLAHREGIIFASACYNSEIGQVFDKLGEDAAMDKVKWYKETFGNNFYLEIMLLDFNKQKPYDVFLLKAHERFGIPLIVTTDTHYNLPEDSHYQRLMLMVETKRTILEVQQALAEGKTDDFAAQDNNLWKKSEAELDEKWEKDYSDVIDYDLFKEAKRNTVRICERAKGVSLDRSNKLPRFPDEEDRLKEAVIRGFQARRLPKNKVYLDRIKEEYDLIKEKGFCSYFIIEKMMVDAARDACPRLLGWGSGVEAVGPGRGSGAGSLVNYCLGITDVDPLKHDLLFSRFLSPARGGRQMKLRFTDEPLAKTA
jgi:DNA polymerase-3 subunit alpha